MNKRKYMNKRIKVAFLLGSLNRGGTETLLLDTLGRKDLLPECICIYRKTGVLEEAFKMTGVKLFKMSPSKNIIKYFIQLRQILQSEEVSVMHAQQPIDALYAKIASFRLNKKLILTLHGYDFTTKLVGKIILHYILKRTHTNIYVSNHVKNYYLNKYSLSHEKQKTVYNGVSFSKFENLASIKTEFRNELGIDANTILMAMVGNFVHGRDQMTVCRYLKLLHNKGVDFHFVFVGKKSDTNQELYDNCVSYCHEQGIETKVTFAGSRTDVPEILSQLDAFIYSTDHDTFGIAVVEAMAVGIPIFVNDWPVMSEITEQGKYATLYKTKEEEDLLQHFLLFLQNKEQYQTKAKEAAVFVRNHYSIERHIEELNRVYLTVSDKR